MVDIIRIGVWSFLLRICFSSLSSFIRGIAILYIIRFGVKFFSNLRVFILLVVSIVVVFNEENYEFRSERNICLFLIMRICFSINGCVMFFFLIGFI